METKNKYSHIAIDYPEVDGGSVKGNYSVISLNRPDKLNAITVQTLEEIVSALGSMKFNSNIRCVMIRGIKDYSKKPSFSTGADLSSPFRPKIKPSIPIHMSYAMFLFHKNFDLIEKFPKPIIAAVDGYALGGGCELSLVCDAIIASKRSTFGFSEILRGIFPAGGGTQRMVRNIGLARSTRMLFFGERMSAEQMNQWGLVTFLVENEEFEDFIQKKMVELSSLPTTSHCVIKKCLKFGEQVPPQIGLQFEQLGLGVVSPSEDVQEGINAFIRRKDPKFKGF